MELTPKWIGNSGSVNPGGENYKEIEEKNQGQGIEYPILEKKDDRAKHLRTKNKAYFEVPNLGMWDIL